MYLDPIVVDRITKAINFQRPDRTPIWDSLQNQSVYDYFAPGVPFPRCAAIACEELGVAATYGCMKALTEERTEGSKVHAAQTVWQKDPAFRSLADLRSYSPPKISERELEERVLANHHAKQELYGPRTMYLPPNGGGCFFPGRGNHSGLCIL